VADRPGTTRPVRFFQVHYVPLEQREWWRRQLSRRQSANLSVTEFCRQLGVSVTTFYYWKKRVHEAAPNVPGRVPAECPGVI